ncbi:MAG: Tad domain-containing protein [Chloroflexi bacterium]|nr:Tad domain-containing protein [Chloroflexota bacterium]
MSESQHTQRGQALVILVFALIVLLAILGLAIDGGTFLLEERRMQNASDAAALAGTQKLAQAICDSTVSDAAIADEIELYAERNGVADPLNNMVADYVGLEVVEEELSTTVLGRVGAGHIPPGSSAISVSTTISRSTYFMTLLGQHTTNPSASALAVTGPARAGTTLAPIGVPYEVIKAMVPGITNTFTINLKHYNEDGEGEIMWGAGTHTAQHRGWMNFGYVWNQTEAPEPFERALDATGSAKALELWMSEGWQGMLYADCYWSDGCRTGDYVPSKPGASSTAICAATDPIIYIPVYDAILDYSDVPEPKPSNPNQGGKGGIYHIVGFCGIRITNCSQGGGTITAEIVETIMGEGAFSVDQDTAYDGERACDMHTQVVILWE